MRLFLLPLAFCAFTMLSCTSAKMCGRRVDALDDSAWECSWWISVADAPVVEGRVYNSRNNRAADGAACFVSYCPTRTYFGYRYLSVTVTDRTIMKSVESVPVSSLTSDHQTGWLTTGNDDVNRLISNTLWSQRSNYLSVPTDCPQRNERLGWAADTQIFAETGSFFANTAAFLRKWMRDMRDCQTASGAFPAFAPEGQYDNERMHFGWADKEFMEI